MRLVFLTILLLLQVSVGLCKQHHDDGKDREGSTTAAGTDANTGSNPPAVRDTGPNLDNAGAITSASVNDGYPDEAGKNKTADTLVKRVDSNPGTNLRIRDPHKDHSKGGSKCNESDSEDSGGKSSDSEDSDSEDSDSEDSDSEDSGSEDSGAQGSDTSGNSTVFWIRHGEKPDDGNGLTAQGIARSKCLVNVFGRSSGFEIGKIMAQTPQSDGSQARPFDTVKPLADSLGMKVDTSCQRDDAECVVDAINSFEGPGSVLVSWEHKAIQTNMEALGASDAPSYPSDSFDLIFTQAPPYSQVSKPKNEGCDSAKRKMRGRFATI